MAKTLNRFGAVLFAIFTFGAADAQEPPRDVTLLLSTPASVSFSTGHTIQIPNPVQVYFAKNGTIFLETETGAGIVLPRGATTASFTTDKGNQYTASVSSGATALQVDIVGRQPISLAPGALFVLHNQYTLRLSKQSCELVTGNANGSIEGNAALTMRLNVGTQTCYLQQGRHLKGNLASASASVPSPGAVAPLPESGGESGSYGAFARDETSGRYAYSWNEQTTENADRAALTGCQSANCKVLFRIGPGQCGAMATSITGTVWGGAVRPEKNQAEAAALQSCLARNSGQCAVRGSACN